MNNVNKIFLFAWLTFVGTLLVVKGVLPGWEDERTDFNNYYAASKLMLEGTELSAFYNNETFSEKASNLGVTGGAKFAPFPPPTAVLYAPLSFLDYIVAKRIWLMINLMLLFWLPFRLKHYFRLSIEWCILLLSVFTIPLASNFSFGQAYLLMAFVLLEIIGLIRLSEKRIIIGIVLGLLAVLKYFPIVFLAYIGYNIKGLVKTAVVMVLTVLCVSGLFVLIDPEVYAAYFSVLGDHVQGDLSGQGKYAITFQSLDSLFNNLFVFDPVLNPYPIVDMPIMKPICKGILSIIVCVMCIYLISRDRFRFDWIDISVCIFGLFVLVPASASYHFLFFIVPVVISGKWLFEKKPGLSSWLALILMFLAFSIQFHNIPEFKSLRTLNILAHYPRLWLLSAVFVYLFILRVKEMRLSRNLVVMKVE